jgi:hypothetical protein
MRNIITALKNMPNAFARAFELRNDPLLVKGFSREEEINEHRYDINFSRKERKSLYYIGPERDLENRRKDKENFARDFNKAFQAAKIKLGV